MPKSYRKKLDNIINELLTFLERDYSSQFKKLSTKEDRQLFFLARILTQLKNISKEIEEDEKIIAFPRLEKLEKL